MRPDKIKSTSLMWLESKITKDFMNFINLINFMN